MRIGLDDDLYEELDKIGEKFGITTEALVELAVEKLIEDIKKINK